ncbi:tail fiber protein [Shewanella profunda]|uniref:phage tail protein n=1 Tax=Shewanella profunda TaxID=254793 RepID=UPI00200EDE4E|nr:tail fiber protein [Shewanella profunda]MCL1090359.1 tail fiber protein [Shewanella profunda]
MADPFVGEIRIMANTFPPYGWARCDGQSIPISQNSALYSVLGIAFGGNGSTIFNLPDFRSATPICSGQGSGLSNVVLGEFSGVADVTLLSAEMPEHSHSLNGRTTTGSQGIPDATLYIAADGAGGGGENIFYMVPSTATVDSVMSLNSITAVGSGMSHPNTQPYLTLEFCIALNGEYPVRN